MTCAHCGAEMVRVGLPHAYASSAAGLTPLAAVWLCPGCGNAASEEGERID